MRHQDLRNAFAIIATTATLFGAGAARAQPCVPMQPLPVPGTFSVVNEPDPPIPGVVTTTTINTAPSFFPEGDAFSPNPTNLLPTIYKDSCDSSGDPIPNTLPSAPDNPYNLMADVSAETTLPNRFSPTNDLDDIIRALHDSKNVNQSQIQFAIDILEGNPIANRAYSGFPVLHYNGPLKGKTVEPIVENGETVGGTVTVHQIWYDSHIESDTSYLDPTAVDDVPWIIHYVVDILDRGSGDFANYIMYFNAPHPPITAGGGKPNVGLDGTFFPMAEGQDLGANSEHGRRVEFDIKMAPGGIWNLTYHWGWRLHPPRVQVVENVQLPLPSPNGPMPRNFHEYLTFCPPPHAQPSFGNPFPDCSELLTDESVKLAAINMIGDIAPAKRMWNDFRAIKAGAKGKTLTDLIADLDSAFDDWQHRTRLPKGVPEDPNYDQTLLFVNNTIYGHITGFTRDMQMEIAKFNERGDQVKIKLLNGDYYNHAYVLVDFGGMRGWENTFHNTLPIGGQGPLFTFGRNHWWVNSLGGLPIPPATRPVTSSGPVIGLSSLGDNGDPLVPAINRMPSARITGNAHVKSTVEGWPQLGERNVIVNFHYEPNRRLRMYQFDALHHDVAIWSPH